MSTTEVQVFLPKFRNKNQYKCILERTFNEAIEDAAVNSFSPQNKHKKGLIDVVTPHQELDENLAQDIIAIKSQSGVVMQSKRMNDLKSRVINSSLSRQVSPSKMMGGSIENQSISIASGNINNNYQDRHFLKNRLYQNYKYKWMKDDFDKEILINSVDVVKNQKVRTKIKDFQFQLYHRKHQPLFELTQDNINSLTTKESSIQFNLQSIVPSPLSPHTNPSEQKTQSIISKDIQKLADKSITLNIAPNSPDEEKVFQDRALIRTMKNSLDSTRYANSYRSKSDFRSKKNEKSSASIERTEQLLSSPLSHTNEFESYKQSQSQPYPSSNKNSNTIPSTLPPIFTLDQFSGDIDKIHVFAKIASKGKARTENFIQKEAIFNYPSSSRHSPTFTALSAIGTTSSSPSSKCKTEENPRKRSSSISGTNFVRKNESNQNNRTMITSPNGETEESTTLKLDSILKQQKVRNVQDISEKITFQLKFNNNEIKEAMDQIRIHFWGSISKDKYYYKLTQDQLYYEFLQLCQVSHKVLEMHRQNLFSIPQQETKKNQVKLMDLIKETDKTVLLEVMYEAFPILKDNINALNQRVLDSLNFRLPKLIDKSTFYTIGWEEFQNFIKIAITKSAEYSDIAHFIVKFFNINQHKYIQVDDFLYTLKMICTKVDKYVDSKSKKNIYSAFEQNFKLLGFIKPGLSVFTSSQLRTAIIQNKVNHNELIDLIFESF